MKMNMGESMTGGCYTAIVTPFKDDIGQVDYEGLDKLIEFQIKNDISGILAVGTTGESPTLTWDEHNNVVKQVASKSKGKVTCIAGAGSNNTRETLNAVQHASDAGVDAVLLVDPYYNGPSSLEIRREYIEPVAKAFPKLDIIPYIIPGRTGAQLLPEDIGILSDRYENVNTVKEATGNMENMKKTRKCCGNDFSILSGDDSIVFEMITDPEIKCSGIISVASNIAPKAVVEMIDHTVNNRMDEAKRILNALRPLFDLVTVTTVEQTPFGEVQCRARNPLALKTFMKLIGMPSGGCRQPLGKMTKAGFRRVLDIAKTVYHNNPKILMPAMEFFDLDLYRRINDPLCWEELYYDEY